MKVSLLLNIPIVRLHDQQKEVYAFISEKKQTLEIPD